MRRRSVVFLFVLFALAVFACKKAPKAGEACEKDGDFVCASNTQRMVCTKGQYVVETCTACMQKKGLFSSQSSYSGCFAGGIGPEGSSCAADDSADCDGNVLVKCIQGQYRHFNCGGVGGCRSGPNGVSCDATIGSAGDACRKEKAAVCSIDRQNMLHCHGGKLIADDTCKGPKHCTAHPNGDSTIALDCDESAADVGDPCRTEDSGTCSTDKSTLLVCKGGKYTAWRKCRGSNPTCTIQDDHPNCADLSVADVGDSCIVGGACSSDGKALLQCRNGAFAQTNKCKSCKLSGDQVFCKH